MKNDEVVSLLKQLGACEEAVLKVREHGGTDYKLWQTWHDGCDLVWLLSALHVEDLEAARAELWRVCAAALAESGRVYDAAIAESSRVYDAACEEPRRVYDAAIAEARGVYDAAIAEARGVYNAALAEPRRVYNAARAEPRRVYADGIRRAVPWATVKAAIAAAIAVKEAEGDA
jgi:hypothetical protein